MLMPHYDGRLLTLHVPVAEQVEPGKIETTGGNPGKQINA